jgi:hypothetical protein
MIKWLIYTIYFGVDQIGTSGLRQRRAIRVIKIPLNLPLVKGDFNYPLWKRGARGDFKKEPFSKRIQQGRADYDVTLGHRGVGFDNPRKRG